MSKYSIITDRLGLRNWEEKDSQLAHKMNADVRVMEFFPSNWSLEQTTAFILRMKIHYEKHNFCYFAVDRLDTNTFIGFIGLMHQTYETGFNPFIDIGWRLLPEAWGNGFATEGAKGCVKYAFTILNLPYVYAIAPKLNKKSQRVMQKIGMHEHIYFKHPNIDENDPLCECVAHRIAQE